jgi:molybdopterin-binding protein
MTAPSDDAIGELHAAIATLRAERDAAVARETALVEVLAVIKSTEVMVARESARH